MRNLTRSCDKSLSSCFSISLCSRSNHVAFQTVLLTQGKYGTRLIFPPWHRDDVVMVPSFPFRNCLMRDGLHVECSSDGGQAGWGEVSQKTGIKVSATWRSFSRAQHNQQTALKGRGSKHTILLLTLTINR